METFNTISEMDALREIALQGSQRAAEALGQFSGNTLTVSKADARITQIEEIPQLEADPQEIIVGIDFSITRELPGYTGQNPAEDLTGYLLAFFRLNDAALLLQALLGSTVTNLDELGELELSALGEAGNIIVSSFLASLETLCDTVVVPSPPAVAVDMCAAILTSAVMPVVEAGGDVLLLETEIIPVGDINQQVASCRVFFLPTPQLWTCLHQAFIGRGQ